MYALDFMRPQASVLKEKGQNRYVVKGNGGGISTVSLCHAPSERLEKSASVSTGDDIFQAKRLANITVYLEHLQCKGRHRICFPLDHFE